MYLTSARLDVRLAIVCTRTCAALSSKFAVASARFRSTRSFKMLPPQNRIIAFCSTKKLQPESPQSVRDFQNQHIFLVQMKSPTENPLRLKDPVHEHARDVLEQMRQSESNTYRRPDTRLPNPFNGLWRQQIIQWMYTLVKHCKLRHEAAAGGAYFLDAAVAKGVVKTAGEYQLGALASLYLGLKMFDSPGMRLVKPSSLAKLGNANLTERDIFRMEMQIVRAMCWHLSPPTPNCFLQQYLVLLPIHNTLTRCLIEERTFRIIETAVSKEDFFFVKPSLLGFCALLIGLDQHLEEQKTALIPANPISLWQLRAFLYHINNFANIDHTSVAVSNTVMLLARAMKYAQFSPPRQMPATSATISSSDVDTTSRDHDSKNFATADQQETLGSPTNVILQ